MKKVKLLLASLFFIICCSTSMAQSITVAGKVSDIENGEPLIGAYVKIKGTSTGTFSDSDGIYTITCSSDAVLVFSYLGYETVEEPVNGREIINIALSSSNQLDEVVITAMGMTRSQKSVGYATTTVKSGDLTRAKAISVVSGIQGKVAGVQISTQGGTGSSQKVLVRGVSSFSDNNPLYVVDGIPISNNYSGSISSNSSVDFGNGANDINPDDVETVTVLKGASATALYGSRAANGVIMVTTKKAEGGKVQIDYDGSFMGSNVLRVPQGQDIFGQGWPFWDSKENGSWGPRMDGRMHTYGAWAGYEDEKPKDFVVRSKEFKFVKDNIRNFYERGFETNNNLSIKVGDEALGLFISYGNSYSSGVMPSNADTYNRNSFSMRGNMVHKAFSMNVSLNYVKKNMNRPSAGQGGASGATTFQELLQHGADISFKSHKKYKELYNDTDNYYTAYAENPYWVLANNRNSYSDDKIYGKVDGSYKVLSWLDFTARLGADITNYRMFRRNDKLTFSPGSWSAYNKKSTHAGSYKETFDRKQQLDITLMANARYNITDRLDISGTIGYNYNERRGRYIDSYLYGLNMPGWFSLENGEGRPLTKSYNSCRRLQGIFSQVDLSYDNWAFATFVCRNDWSSTLPIDKNSFFYWGINGAVIFTDAIKSLKGGNISFLKLRLAYGKTGNDAPIYRTYGLFVPARFGIGFGSVDLPIDGVPGLTEDNTIPNNKLKPEITTEAEIGLMANFFDNRVRLDCALYDKTTKDQIIAAAVATESGYTKRARNVGKIRNRGIEITAGFTPIKRDDWSCDINITFTKNWSKVLKLWENTREYVLKSIYQVQYVAMEGRELGIYKVPAVLKDPQGRTVVNAMGIPRINSTEKEEVGSSVPKFNMGFNMKISWKNLSLSALVDWRYGGYFYCYTSQLMYFSGNATPTVYNNRQPFVVPNSVQYIKGKYVENNTPVRWANTYGYYNNASNYIMYKRWILKKDYVKLREVVLSYDFPASLIARTKFVKGICISAIGRNLFMWTPKENNYVDPEASNYGNDLDSEFGEFAAAPTYRVFGGSIKIKF